jgi:drug/metabolite transporter (DMT)-like permease
MARNTVNLATATHTRRVRLQADLILLLTAALWGSGFIAQRVAADYLSPYIFNGLRFFGGMLLILPFVKWRNIHLDRKSIALAIVVGSLLFGGSTFQQIGLHYTTASNAGFVTGLYVVLVPLLLAMWWRKLPTMVSIVASLLAAAGLFMLSTGGHLQLTLGDGLELTGALLWALHMICLGKLVRRLDVMHAVILQNLVCALLNFATAALFERAPFHGMDVAWWTVIYGAVFSVALGFTMQGIGQRVAPAADAALLLSLEAVFAAIFGWIFLNERLVLLQIIGCALMLSGMLLAQADVLRQT